MKTKLIAMARFTTRVLLHDAEDGGGTYDLLHTAMEEEGFSRTIIDSNGIEYHLPFAEYNLIGTYTRTQVLSMASAAVRQTGKKAAILITKGPRTWRGLRQVIPK